MKISDDNDLRDGSDLDAEYGVTQALVGGSIIGGEEKGEENIISWHAYMQNIPAKIKEEGKALMEEMQQGFSASKEYFNNLSKDMKVVLNPKTAANKAVESFANMKENFGKLRDYVKNDMGSDLHKKFNSFINAVCKSFSEFKGAARDQMIPAYNKANDAFHDMYNKVVQSKAYKQAAAVGAEMAKSTKGAYKATVGKAVNKAKSTKSRSI